MTKQQAIKNNEEAQVGIGTMIVFIATVLVAAVAAGVLIDMSGKLQERSSRTGAEATQQVASNFEFQSIVGKRDSASSAYLDDLEINLRLAPGASAIDLNQMKIQMQNGTSLTTLDYAAADAAGKYTATAVRDADSSFSTASPVMNAGDLVRITIALDTQATEFPVRDSVQLTLIPEFGQAAVAGFVTPPSYGIATVINLR